MGVSAVGDRGIRPRTVPLLLGIFLVALVIASYFFLPAIAPGVREAAKEKCNELTGANFRTYRLEWKLPSSPAWDQPHWVCSDTRDSHAKVHDLGWWVSPF